jgi:hypothetical protein
MGHFLSPLILVAVKLFQAARVLLSHTVWGLFFGIQKFSGLDLGCGLVQRVGLWRLLAGSHISSFNISFLIKRLE